MKKFEEVGFNEVIAKTGIHKSYMNDKYLVLVRFLDEKKEFDGWVWLSFKRKDKRVIKDWREFQKIKNAICGEDREGVELYPSEKRLVDTSNQFHIFVMPKGDVFPFGYQDRAVVEGHGGGWNDGSRQRHFKQGEEPSDIKTVEEMKESAKQFLED